MSPADLLVCRLLMAFTLFFVFDALGTLGLLFHGRWVTFPNADLVAIVAITFSIAAGALAKHHLSGSVDSDVASVARRVPPLSGMARLVLTTVVGGFVLVAAILIIGFPRGYEAYAYHLPSVVNFFRDGSLRIWDMAYVHTYPANASLWDGFWLRLLPERVVSLVDLPVEQKGTQTEESLPACGCCETR